MSDLLLREFAERAERLVDLPDLADLERRGDRRRTRRRAAAGAVLAAVLVVGGVAFGQVRDLRADEKPVKVPPDRRGSALAYPGNLMADLEPGRYEVQPVGPGGPAARFTLPAGWNSWVTPNRYDTLDDPTYASNEDALEELTWYEQLSFLHVLTVVGRDCGDTALVVDWGAERLARAIVRAPRFRLVTPLEQTSLSGYPAFHARLRVAPPPYACPEDFLYSTNPMGDRGYPDTNSELWVVDVDGDTVVITAEWTEEVPRAEWREMLAVVETMEVLAGEE